MKIKPSRIILIQSLMAIGLISVGFSSWIRVENKGDNAQISNIEIGDVIDERGWISRTNVTKLEYCSDGFVNDGEVGNIGFIALTYSIDAKKIKSDISSSTNFKPTFILEQVDSNSSSYSLISLISKYELTYSSNLNSTAEEKTLTPTKTNTKVSSSTDTLSLTTSGIETYYLNLKYTLTKTDSFAIDVGKLASVSFVFELLLEVN